jgi:hypothetical protein
MSWPGLGISDPPASTGDPLFFTLSEVIGRGVAIEWYEAVAVVRAVCDSVVGPRGGPGIPELNQIRLRSTGEVDVVGAAAVDEPVRRLGQLLQALITQTDAPVQLRLMITQATSPTPPFASVQEYSDALAYFERPDRTGLLGRLFQRAAATRPPSEATPTPTIDEVAPLPRAKSDRPSGEGTRTSTRPPLVKMLAGLAVVIAILAGGYWYARRNGVRGPSRAKVNKVADIASNTLGKAVVSGVSAVTEQLGLGRIVPADAKPSPAPSPPHVDAPAAKPSRPASASAMSARAMPMPGIAFDLPSTGRLSNQPTTYDAVVSDAETDPEAFSSTYGPGSAGVTPPEAVEPRLPRELPPDMTRDQLGRIELIVAVDGSVESVKLLGPPRNVKDAMFLSVAKAWQFRPALKDGVPVRYRKIIWVASQ